MDQQEWLFFFQEVLGAEKLAEAKKVKHDVHATLLREFIEPNMDAIDNFTKQENNPGYMAYALEYALK